MYLRNRSEKIELLKGVALFANLSSRQLNEVAKHADEVHYDAGTTMTREGQTGGELFVIATGKAKVTRKRRQIAMLGPGDPIGEMSLLDREPRSATVVTVEPTVVLVVGLREFSPLLRSMPALGENLLKTLAGRLRAADQALAD